VHVIGPSLSKAEELKAPCSRSTDSGELRQMERSRKAGMRTYINSTVTETGGLFLSESPGHCSFPESSRFSQRTPKQRQIHPLKTRTIGIITR
jgi:hypothetical protein